MYTRGNDGYTSFWCVQPDAVDQNFVLFNGTFGRMGRGRDGMYKVSNWVYQQLQVDFQAQVLQFYPDGAEAFYEELLDAFEQVQFNFKSINHMLKL